MRAGSPAFVMLWVACLSAIQRSRSALIGPPLVCLLDPASLSVFVHELLGFPNCAGSNGLVKAEGGFQLTLRKFYENEQHAPAILAVDSRLMTEANDPRVH
ncbi:hypothetical protein BS47DRAFT_1403001 [Hydnum rufescens UP504]|uniref:Secreted protein n=1 Tax=Hydnum rufescens UP504 TaxID=1448309 RepID=A0A9P6DLU4_9AGAM|nr:hypothetical protein BS47DRAFT_1403001 [Hydnum rufescens UP504]